MENDLLKLQKSSAAKIITDCTQPTIMMAYVNYTYPYSGFGNPNRRNTIGDTGEFVIYESANHECVMVCYNVTDDKIIVKRTRGDNNVFPTFMDFACSMYNMCFSEVFGTYGIRHKTSITVISDKDTVARTRPYLEELFESYRKTSGVLLLTDCYTAVFDMFLFRHIASDSRGRLYLDDKRSADTEEAITATIKEYKLVTSSFMQFNTDNGDVDEPQQKITSLSVQIKDKEESDEDSEKSAEQLVNKINQPADNIFEEENPNQKPTIQHLTSINANENDILRFVIIVGDKLWAEPRYVRTKNFPKVIHDELQKVVECIPMFESGKFIIQAEKITIE